jgi:hypothetical protein
LLMYSRKVPTEFLTLFISCIVTRFLIYENMWHISQRISVFTATCFGGTPPPSWRIHTNI